MLPVEFLFVGKKAQRVYERCFQPLRRKYKMNQSSLDVLLFLANHSACNTARDICTIRGIKAGIVSVSVENLIQQGYLTRGPDPTDRRVRRLELTERAQPLIAEGRRTQQFFASALVSDISQEELAAYITVTEKIFSTIERLDREGEQRD